jgi:hypothetical protein
VPLTGGGKAGPGEGVNASMVSSGSSSFMTTASDAMDLDDAAFASVSQDTGGWVTYLPTSLPTYLPT